ncbi:hypothetical protein CHS0354_018494 [Potamilus streckersoni]|uniref:4Fe-4S ferredoxin-type domain-containing protein n=1 Tax=Potamilus streckersoni TaxID=2493646 RepID=A0AAE0WAA7_9BIVA|nr:hypothetical protein CHS0354_018494 [Potamilus streckersoni]
MVTEETHLNTHLEKEGYRVLETDLGEYIIQLINEAPSHIVAPAMHKNFEQIRDIILGADYPDKDNVNEQMLTKIVRERMREDYKRADAGITGVNFAAADTGTLCLVENEGNGRYSSTVPRIHIAVMGLEKTIASFRQLPDLLQALTVSATGQKISTYVNMISSPRRPGEADGPDEVHLVILDNGRSDMLADPDLMKTLLCIRCGACMNHCPVYKHIGGHAYGTTIPGPIGKILMPQLLGLETAGHLAGASSLCGACGEVCPVKIPIPDILIRLRAKALQQRSRRHPVSSRFSGEAAAWKIWAMLNSSPRLYRIFRRMLGYMQGLPLARFPIIKEWCSQFQSSFSDTEKPFSEFIAMTTRNEISEVLIKQDRVYFSAGGQMYSAIIPEGYDNIGDYLNNAKVRYRYEAKDQGGLFLIILSSWLPVLLIIGVMLFFSRQLQNGSKIMGFGKFKIRNAPKTQNKITFNDVAGIDDAKEELKEIVEFLKSPQKFNDIGARIPTGILLTGSPGTGKTLLAKAVAGESDAGFFSISGSDFVEMFVGVGASRVRDLFSQARQNSPCIIFIDEIDAVGRQRGSGLGGGNDEREQTLNQLLVEMDGFNKNTGIIILASTNRPDVLDPALLRPGRFDRQVYVNKPDINGREKILQIHSKEVKLDSDVDLRKLATGTVGFTGADLANLINEAALLAGRKKRETVTNADFEEARDKILMGTERKTFIMKEKEREATSYHEAGHALISVLSKFLDPIHKVTIIPRGRSLGVTMFFPEHDTHHMSKGKILETLEMLMGGTRSGGNHL